MAIQQAWLKELGPEERQQVKNLVQNNKIVLDKLVQIWYNRLREVETVNTVDYDSPSWLAKQAHANGYSEALRYMIKICTVTDE